MSTLIVFLPPRDPAVPSQEWQLPEMPFLLVDKSGRKERTGRAGLAFLPRAAATILIVAARDTVMLATTLPPLKGARLRQALPNVIEDQLIQDAQTCHIALDPQPLADGSRMVAVIDRGWFRFIFEAFNSRGHRNLRAVPVARCLPQASISASKAADTTTPDASAGIASARIKAAAPAAGSESVKGSDVGTASAVEREAGSDVSQPLVAVVLGTVAQTAPAILAETETGTEPVQFMAGEPRIELAVARGAQGEGLAVPMSALGATLAALAGGTSVTVYELTGLPGGEPRLPGQATSAQSVHVSDVVGVRPLPFETLASNALAARFDLCQFEFESRPWRLDRATVRRLRLPIALVAASLLVAVIGANVQWLMLAHQRDGLSAQMTELLLNAFPKTTAVLDAPTQMTQQLESLRVAAGETSPTDFLSLAARFERSLGGLPVNGIAALDYHDRRLDVTFKPDVKPDQGLDQRLAQNGLVGEIDSNTGKWVIRNGGAQ